jgi:hypothetical protein
MVYRGLPVEQARQSFEALKSGEPPTLPPELPKLAVRRKLRIPATKQDA